MVRQILSDLAALDCSHRIKKHVESTPVVDWMDCEIFDAEHIAAAGSDCGNNAHNRVAADRFFGFADRLL